MRYSDGSNAFVMVYIVATSLTEIIFIIVKLLVDLFSEGCCSLLVVFRFNWDMSIEEAVELARRSIYHATFRDGASGGVVSGKQFLSLSSSLTGFFLALLCAPLSESAYHVKYVKRDLMQGCHD